MWLVRGGKDEGAEQGFFFEWCEEKYLVWMNSFKKHRRRGT